MLYLALLVALLIKAEGNNAAQLYRYWYYFDQLPFQLWTCGLCLYFQSTGRKR
ncbi:hypothetical protein ACI8B_180164 [Acinetobacter proteolyticus]|uniref:Uncharacterized protein n=1 Tax=Acinetobacter proteolyticus TaxID=1776741 RepID=A0A653K379_9GAMM|nr:hypothetical protein ACI8B_180164 [Acinetobacter proteolyticus]